MTSYPWHIFECVYSSFYAFFLGKDENILHTLHSGKVGGGWKKWGSYVTQGAVTLPPTTHTFYKYLVHPTLIWAKATRTLLAACRWGKVRMTPYNPKLRNPNFCALPSQCKTRNSNYERSQSAECLWSFSVSRQFSPAHMGPNFLASRTHQKT